MIISLLRLQTLIVSLIIVRIKASDPWIVQDCSNVAQGDCILRSIVNESLNLIDPMQLPARPYHMEYNEVVPPIPTPSPQSLYKDFDDKYGLDDNDENSDHDSDNDIDTDIADDDKRQSTCANSTCSSDTDKDKKDTLMISSIGWNATGSKDIFCPMDAKMCADGSFVNRRGALCEFDNCTENLKNYFSVAHSITLTLPLISTFTSLFSFIFF